MRGIFLVLSLATIALVLTTDCVNAGDGLDCYDERTETTVKRGETFYPENDCIRMFCTENGELHPEPCMLEIPPGARIVYGDTTAKWPDCCPNFEFEEMNEH